MKNKLKPISSTRKPSSKINSNNKREIIVAQISTNPTLSNDFLPVK